jgi:peptidoglycan/LPS O-acetylase OafA/YrhL
MKYRPDIDGLRAVAVVSVIVYHAEFIFKGRWLLKGGFLGVDIFFVISGFLITSIIYSELKNDTFSFKQFYERRARRILPILFFILLVSCATSYFLFTPSHFSSFAKSVISTILFYSNFNFYYSGQEYAAQSSHLKPLLHTWSLSIEEQFYFIFPPLLIFIHRLKKIKPIHILCLLSLASLTLAHWASTRHPQINFYLLPSRMWELLAGSILVFVPAPLAKIRRLPLASFLPDLGLILIGYSIIFLHGAQHFPSLKTVTPVLGTCLILAFPNKKSISTKILSTKPFVYIGLISYSLYLWHYPTFAFTRIYTGLAINHILAIKLIAIVFIASLLSYKLIEQPFRNRRKISSTFIFKFSIMMSLFFITFSLIITSTNGLSHRVPKILQQIYSSKKPWLITSQSNKQCYERSKDFCSFNPKKNQKVILVGDSQIATLMEPLKNELHRFNFIPLTVGGCYYSPGFDEIDLVTKRPSPCSNKQQKKFDEVIFRSTNSIVIIGGQLQLYLSETFFNNQEGGARAVGSYNYRLPHGMKNLNKQQRFTHFSENIKKSILNIIEKGNKVILLYPVPEVGWDVPQELLYIHYKKIIPKYAITSSSKVFEKRSQPAFKVLDSIGSHPGLYRVFPHKLFCDSQVKGRCITHDDTNLFYYDDYHLSTAGAQLLSRDIIDLIQKISKE